MNAPGRLLARLVALETRAFPAATTCHTCGAPRPAQSTLVCVNGDGSLRWGACADCGIALNEIGRPMCPVPCPDARHPYPVEVFGPERWFMYDSL